MGKMEIMQNNHIKRCFRLIRGCRTTGLVEVFVFILLFIILSSISSQAVNVENMDLRSQIGQHIIVSLGKDFNRDYLDELISKGTIGGVLFLNNSYRTVSELKKLIADLKKKSLEKGNLCLFIAADQEGGKIFSYNSGNYTLSPPASIMGKLGDSVYAYSRGYLTGMEMKHIGFNLNFAPVLDLSEADSRSVIGARAISSNPDISGSLGTDYIKGLTDAGIIAAAKHFPGHGMVEGDSHYILPSDSVSEDVLKKHLKPFKTAAPHVPMIMSAHIKLKGYDDKYPVSLSAYFLKDLLRKQLNFEGIIISDNLSMAAVSSSMDLIEASKTALIAGNDIILIPLTFLHHRIISALENDLESAVLNPDYFNESTVRIIECKNKFKIADNCLSY